MEEGGDAFGPPLLLQGRRRPILERKPKPQPSKPSHPICPSIISSWQSSADLAQLCYGDGGKGKRLFLATHSHPHRRRLALIFRDAQSEDSFVPTNSKKDAGRGRCAGYDSPFCIRREDKEKAYGETICAEQRKPSSGPPFSPHLLSLSTFSLECAPSPLFKANTAAQREAPPLPPSQDAFLPSSFRKRPGEAKCPLKG